MKQLFQRSGFTLIELLVAVTVTLVLAGLMLAVTAGTLDLWRRTQDSFTASAQAKLVFDYLERDLQSAVFRADGQTWLAVDISNAPGNLTNHGWLIEGALKPASLESQRYLPPVANGSAPGVEEARFGLSGVWLRLITTNMDNDGSVPVAVSYQIARRPVSGAINASSPADVRYTLFRAAVAADGTFATGYDVTVAGYGSSAATPPAARSAGTLTNPNTASDVIATNVVDFGVWFYGRAASGSLTRIFPAVSSGNIVHRADREEIFPAVADVMVRILTEEGARIIGGMERGSGTLLRPTAYATDGEWWWAVVEANSRVVVRRIEIKGASS